MIGIRMRRISSAGDFFFRLRAVEEPVREREDVLRADERPEVRFEDVEAVRRRLGL